MHEPAESLAPTTIDRHRATASLQEELEAIDWYDQRVDAATDDALKAVLAHNRDDEKEHAAMALEWLRRHDPVLDQQLRIYLFTTGDITEAASTTAESGGPSDGSLGIGGLKGASQ